MADEPTNRELVNLIQRNHADNREDWLDLKTQFTRELGNLVAQLQQYVLREVYEADKRALAAREQAIHDRFARNEAQAEADRREVAEHRRSKWERFWVVAAAVAGAAATVVLTVLFTHGGGHA